MNVLIDKFDVFAGGFWLTLQICVLAAIGALILGAVVAVLRISPVPPLRTLGTAYVTVFRNMPLTVVMFFAAFALPALGSNGTSSGSRYWTRYSPGSAPTCRTSASP